MDQLQAAQPVRIAIVKVQAPTLVRADQIGARCIRCAHHARILATLINVRALAVRVELEASWTNTESTSFRENTLLIGPTWLRDGAAHRYLQAIVHLTFVAKWTATSVAGQADQVAWTILIGIALHLLATNRPGIAKELWPAIALLLVVLDTAHSILATGALAQARIDALAVQARLVEATLLVH